MPKLEEFNIWIEKNHHPFYSLYLSSLDFVIIMLGIQEGFGISLIQHISA